MNNNATKTIIFPELTANLLLDGCTLVDNIFADLWNQMGITAKMKRMGFTKRSGTAPNQLVYCLMLWVWLKVDSVAMFALESLRTFTGAQKDALYAAMNNEDWNWRRLQLSLSLQTVKTLKAAEETSAFVLDDSIKVRHGKKMPGVSSHFDHTTGRHVMGQQVLTLGLSCAEGFVPIDNELFISQTNAQGLNQAFNDGRSVVARRYAVAQKQTKPQMARDMIRRAQRTGINAKYLLADAWFGTKAMIAMAEDQGLVPILRMKKNTMRYRFQESKAGVSTYRDLDANGLYHVNVRGRWEKIEGKAYQARTMAVELNLNGVGEKERWVPIRLLFVRGVATEKKQAGKHDWALFLTTETNLEPSKILALYAMRWAIEVYFKEAKQYLGFLKEQSKNYAAYIASIHLTSMRFCMLMTAKSLNQVGGVSDMRQKITENIISIDYVTRLWQVFQSILSGALNEIKEEIRDSFGKITQTIDRHIQEFFMQTLQLDVKIMQLET